MNSILIEWISQRKEFQGRNMNVRLMEDVYFDELRVDIGEQYLLCHQVCSC